MKNFKYNLILDIIMWVTVYLAAFKDNQYANNIYYLYLIMLSVAGLVGVILVFINDDYFKKYMEKSTYEPSSFKKWYGYATTLIKVVVFAGIGWFYSATICIILFLAHLRIYKYLEEDQHG